MSIDDKRKCAAMIHAIVDRAIAEGTASELTKQDGHRYAAELYKEAYEQEQELREQGLRSFAEL